MSMFFDISSSAFPSHGSMGERVESGMSLRDYLAAHAPFTQADAVKFAEASNTEITGPQMIEILVYLRYKYADAMLVQREKGE